MPQPKRTLFKVNRCEQCRQLKHKCPGEKPECSRCQRLGKRCVYPTAPPGTVSPFPNSRLSGTGARRLDSHSRDEELDHIQRNKRTSALAADADGDVNMSSDSSMQASSIIELRSSSPHPASSMTSQQQRSRRPTVPSLKARQMRESPAVSEHTPVPAVNPSKYVVYNDEAQQRLIAEEGRKALEAEAMFEARRTTGGLPEAQAVRFADIETSKWPPEIQKEWQSISAKVQEDIDLEDGRIEWDANGTKKASLRQRIVEVRELAQKRKGYPELVVALTRLTASLRLCHDFYEALGANITTANELKWAIERPQFQK